MTEAISKQTPPPVARQRPTGGDSTSRWVVFAHALAFVLGFTLIFTLLGAAAGLLGRSLNLYMPLLQRLGAILLVVFGLATIGVFGWMSAAIAKRVDLNKNPAAAALVQLLDIPSQLMYTEKRVTGMHQISPRWGYLSSSLMGMSFAAGWVPCIGPILASILFLAGDTQTVLQGAGLLLVYSLGLGIPFLLTGAMFSVMSRWLRKLNRHAGIISIISGFFMLYVAYLLWTDSLALLTTQFIFLNEWVFAAEDWISSITGTGGDLFATGNVTAGLLAFGAGLISFLSPCVLPLVPAYIGYLSGTAVGSRPRA